MTEGLPTPLAEPAPPDGGSGFVPGWVRGATNLFAMLVTAVLVGVALFLVAAVTTTLGFRLTMLAFYLAVIGMLGRWRWIETPVLAVLGSFAAYYILVEWLKLPLPVGALGF